MSRTTLAVAIGAAVALPLAVSATATAGTPAQGCIASGGGYSFNACTGDFTYPAAKGHRWVVVHGGSWSGPLVSGPVRLTNRAGTVHLAPVCGIGQADVRNSKDGTHNGEYVWGKKFINRDGSCAPKPTETPTHTPTQTPTHTPTHTPTGSPTSTPPSPSPSSSSSTRGPAPSHSSKQPPKRSSTSRSSRLAPAPTSSVPTVAPSTASAELAYTGSNAPLYGLGGLAFLGGGWVLVRVSRRRGEHS